MGEEKLNFNIDVCDVYKALVWAYHNEMRSRPDKRAIKRIIDLIEKSGAIEETAPPTINGLEALKQAVEKYGKGETNT